MLVFHRKIYNCKLRPSH